MIGGFRTKIQIGYAESHRGFLPVVFDSPRDRGRNDYPEARMLGPDFGHFVVGGGVPNSLDSFGNLEVSPPVTVRGRNYPLGRILVGGRRDGDLSHSARQMMAEVRQFLDAQRVQFPFEIFTDWLAVGHVDEIVSFVPDDAAPKGFRCLLASPAKVKSILLELQKRAMVRRCCSRASVGATEKTLNCLSTSSWPRRISGRATNPINRS